MNIIADALNFIDDDIAADALKTIINDKFPKSVTVKYRELRKPAADFHGSRSAKAICITAATFIMCAVIAVCAIFVITGYNSEDPRAHGNHKSLSDFNEIYTLYPDKEMAENLSSLEFENLAIDLYYGESGIESDWQNPDDWNSLIISGDNLQTSESISIICLFEGTIDDWNECNSSVYTEDSKFILLYGDITVYAAYYSKETKNECYAIFESNGIVYEIELVNYISSYSGETSRDTLYSILGVLLSG